MQKYSNHQMKSAQDEENSKIEDILILNLSVMGTIRTKSNRKINFQLIVIPKSEQYEKPVDLDFFMMHRAHKLNDAD